MLVFRSFAIGLSAACFALLVMRPSTIVLRESLHVDLPPSIEAARTVPLPPAPPTIIDAAPGITAEQLALSIRLAPGEQIAWVDDAPVYCDLGAGLSLAQRDLRSHQFVDIGVSGPAGERRVLVLLH